MCSLSHPAPWAACSLWVTSGGRWGHHECASLWAASSSPRYLTLRAGCQDSWASCLPVVRGCPAGHQRVAELVCFLVCGKGHLPGREVSGIPGRTGWGHSGSWPRSADSSLPVSDLAWRLLGPFLASRLPSSLAGSQNLLQPFLAYFPWYLGVAVESPISAPTHLGGAGV